ncbi:hypothetical protein VNI00_018170 [Paramarasmius palmivorus]|uniref:Uncharacterized protein n=1 Tax=Paramarasmius palmivorus TaxID=297713 RepID=A0AAW0B1I5_9AGAR
MSKVQLTLSTPVVFACLRSSFKSVCPEHQLIIMFRSSRICIITTLFALFTSAFKIVVPSKADVDAVSNIAANWTWSPGDPTDISFNLFPNTPNICVPGQGFPIQAKGIRADLERATPDSQGQKHGFFDFTVNKTGKDPLESITQSNVITITPRSQSGPSGGTIAGAVIGGVFLAGLAVAAFVIYRRIRHQRRVVAFHNERMTIRQMGNAPLHRTTSAFSTADMSEKGIGSYDSGTLSSLPRIAPNFSPRNTLQPLRRYPG